MIEHWFDIRTREERREDAVQALMTETGWSYDRALRELLEAEADSGADKAYGDAYSRGDRQ